MARLNPQPGPVLVVTGPSGVGKGTVISHLRRLDPGLWVSVSVTTRAPRAGEVNGQDYHFCSEEEFERLRAGGTLLESAHFAGHSYGTPAAPVRQRMAQGLPTVLEIDVQGAEQVARSCPEAVRVLLLPPDEEELRRRLIGRGTEDAASLDRRLVAARAEIAAAERFPHVLVNVDAEDTARRLLALVQSLAVTDPAPPQPAGDEVDLP